MLPTPAVEGAPSPLLDRLRTATRAAHTALEEDLALLSTPLRRARFVQVLQGFHAFHLAWEPRVAALIGDEALLAPRRRLPALRRDLAALGATPGGAAPFDLRYLSSPSAAWGSLYVVEGSTLGGQVIAKALRQGADWAPAEGLTYFNPHGRATGALWRAFRDALEAAPGLDGAEVEAGARATFDALRRGVAPRLEQAA